MNKEQSKTVEDSKKHLQWIYDRMVEVHKENPNYDYMIKFLSILNASQKEKKKETNHATIEIMYVSQKAHDDDIWMAPYVGYEVVVVTQPDGQMDIVFNEEIYYNEADKLKYLQEERVEN